MRNSLRPTETLSPAEPTPDHSFKAHFSLSLQKMRQIIAFVDANPFSQTLLPCGNELNWAEKEVR